MDNSQEEAEPEIEIGAMTLTKSKTPGKLWITGLDKKAFEIDAKVIEDVLRRLF